MLTISKLAQTLGLTPDAIRHYTECGILSPTVNPWTHYRYYSAHDALLTGHVRALRSLDFSLPETETFHTSPVDTQLAILEERRAAIDAQIAVLTQQRARLEKVETFVKKSTLCHGVVEDVTRDAIHSLYTLGPDENHNQAARALVPQWIAQFPYIHLSIKIPLAELTAPAFSGVYHASLGVGVTDDYVSLTGLSLDAPVETVPAGRCLILYLSCRDPLTLTAQDLAPLLNYAREHKLHFTHSSTGRILTLQKTPDGVRYYLLIRVRVRESTDS